MYISNQLTRLNANNIYINYGHGIKAMIFYIFPITDTIVCGLESFQTV